jgi:parallel beta-helix repeat protein
MKRLRAFAVLAVCSAITVPVHAETTICTVIASVPATISAPGIYCLKSDLMTSIASGVAITIDSNFVTLDLNGWRLGGGAAGLGTSAYGIRVIDRRGVTVRNGSVKGFYCGVAFESSGVSTANLVEDIRADGNTQMGIYMGSSYSVVRNNQVSNTGGISIDGFGDAWGIRSAGTGNQILNNVVSSTVATKAGAAAYGIESAGAKAVIAGNSIADMRSTSDWVEGIRAGIGNVIVDNKVFGAIGFAELGIHALGENIVQRNRVAGYIYGMSIWSSIYSGNVVVGNMYAPYSGGALAHGTTNWPLP